MVKINNISKCFNGSLFLGALLFVTLFAVNNAEAQKAKAAVDTKTELTESDGGVKSIKIGVVLDDDNKKVKKYAVELVETIRDLVKESAAVVLDESKILKGDNTLITARDNLNRLQDDKDVNLIIAFGALASNEAIHMKPKKNIFAPFVVDPVVQRAPLTKDGTSGIEKLNYLIHAPSFKESVYEFKSALQIKNITVITDSFLDGKSIEEQKKILENALMDSEVDLTVLPYNDSLTAKDIPEGTDGVFVFPLFTIEKEKKIALFKNLSDKKIKTFAYRGPIDVDNGALMTFTDRVDLERLNRRIAINVTKFIEDKKPLSSMTADFVENGTLYINSQVATVVDYKPTRSTIIKAGIEQDVSDGSELTLKEAVKEAVENNLSYLSAISTNRADKQDLWSAWTNYFPHLFIKGGYTRVDDETAKTLSSTTPKQSVSGEIGFLQNILDYRAIANISIQTALNRGRDAALRQAKLDIVQTSASAYYNLQIAKANVQIFESNLEVTRYNLQVARRKGAVGITGPAEVYRWESQEATDMQQVLIEKNRLESAYFVLNRVLHRPIDSTYKISESNFFIDDKGSNEKKEWLDILEHPDRYQQFKDFMVEKGIETSPELKQVDALVKAKGKEQRKNIAGFIVPQIYAQGTVSKRFWNSEQESGATAPLAVPEKSAALNIGLNWDIFEGGSKIASHKKARMEKRVYEYNSEDLKEILKENIYSGISNLTVAYESVKLTKIAADSAKKNLDIAKEAYGLGTLSLEILVDAQRQSFNANQALANSKFQFKLTTLALMRSINEIDDYILNGDVDLELIKEFNDKVGKPE